MSYSFTSYIARKVTMSQRSRPLPVPLIAIVFLACSTVVHCQSNGPIRLWRSGYTLLSYTSGRVQVIRNGQWGNICDDASFGLTEATVICHQLGYTGASSYSRTSSDSFGTDISPTVLSSVDCSTSSYLVILQCSYDSTPPSSCTNSDDVSVTCFSTRIWDNPYNGQIRLTEGITVNQGLVEVYCSGQWGTVCDDRFGKSDADTICRQLGYYSAYNYNQLSIQGSSSQPIWLTDVSCPSPKPCIGDCISSCPVSHSCLHNEDVTITCHSQFHYTETIELTCGNKLPTDIQNGPIRLLRNGVISPSYTSGRVQLVYNRRWGNINSCPVSFTITEAAVVCHQLGYTGASSQTRAAEDSFGFDSNPTVISNVRCSTSAYLVILQCSFSSSTSSCSLDSNDVGVHCYTTRIWDNPYNGQIRLTGGATVNQGLVEVYCSGQWGTVCDDGFGQNDANTICRQLGYYSAYRYDHLSMRGNSSQPVWLSNIPCTSTRSCLSDCIDCPSSRSCDHFEDITIECHSPSKITTVTTNTCVMSGTASSNGPIRLWRDGVSSTLYTAGRVQLLYNSQWGNICDDTEFGLSAAIVICHQLGYIGATSYSRTRDDVYGTDTSPTVVNNLDCRVSTYLVILQCSFSTSISSSCTDDYDVSVTCYPNRIWENPYTLQVRLTGGATVNQGLVEVYCSGQWGTVCDDGFGQNEADTICRQLGYYSANQYDHLSITGSTDMSIWLDNAVCNTRGPCIGFCQGCQSSHNCVHNQDVTIECHSPSHYNETTTSTCVDASPSGTASLASVNIGAIVGGTVGGILVLLCVFALILGCMIKQHRTKSQSTGRVNYSTARQTATATSTRSVPPQPQQPPAAYTIPQPEAAGSTFTYSYNQPTDPTITAAPPPAYGLHDNFATYKGQNVDAPPYMYNETRSSFSQPPTAPPLYPSQPSFVHPPPYQPQA